MRQFLAVIGGLLTVFVFAYPFWDRPWLYHPITIASASGFVIALIADNKYWIPGSIVGLLIGSFLLYPFIFGMPGDEMWVPVTMDYVQMISGFVCPVLCAEVTAWRMKRYIVQYEAKRKLTE
ncbi:MAG: hypothetical protein ACYC0V_02170 [Armatimonadota bacterium]